MNLQRASDSVCLLAAELLVAHVVKLGSEGQTVFLKKNAV